MKQSLSHDACRRNEQAHAGFCADSNDNYTPVARAGHAVLLVLHDAQLLCNIYEFLEVGVPSHKNERLIAQGAELKLLALFERRC
jgi:hypothetical protein